MAGARGLWGLLPGALRKAVPATSPASSAPELPAVVSAGTPVLRTAARPVPPERILTSEFQEMVQHMTQIMREQNGCGLAAPQIGEPWRLFVMEMRAEDVEALSKRVNIQRLHICPVPLTVVFNPELRPLGKERVCHREGCLSVPGYSAFVERYLRVRTTGLDQQGKRLDIDASGWKARILQHEVDHLNGVLYIDSMRSRTFAAQHLPSQFPTPDDVADRP
eukprot:m.106968 g.106968  ORF g.106968 m.106968 type:complete len:221 (+) comp19021_c0_seq3:1493-2155(+)